MAINCKYCGTELPRDDARFCNNCGMLVPSHPFSPQSLSAAKSPSHSSLPPVPVKQQEGNKPALREQVAYLPPTRPKRRLTQETSSEQPGTEDIEKTPDIQNRKQQKKPPETPKPEIQEKAPVSGEPASPAKASARVQPRSLPNISRVRESTARDRTTQHAPEAPQQQAPAWPTAMTHISVKETSTPEKEARPGPRPTPAPPSRQPAPARELRVKVWEPEKEAAQDYEIEYQSTTPLLKQEQERSTTTAPSPTRSDNAIQEPTERDRYIDHRQPEIVHRLSTPAPLTPTPAQEYSAGSTQQREDAVPVQTTRRPRRFPILIAAILLVVLVLGGVGVWIVTTQPFSVAPITQPQLSFSDTNLGIALSYPNGWTKQVESGKSTAHFYASNHTAEVDISVANASGDVNQALQQQATKLGMGGAKAGTPLTFAGATWQQLQGNLQQSGANYTGTILATVHGNHLFMIVQMAPQSNYTDWEKEFFSPLRETLRFL